MKTNKRPRNEQSDYITLYLDLLEEYGEASGLSLKEFDNIAGEASFSDPSKALYYLLRYGMVVPSDDGEVRLRNLSPTDTAFHFLPENDQNAICEFNLKKLYDDSIDTSLKSGEDLHS
jgi:hypothetical protein